MGGFRVGVLEVGEGFFCCFCRYFYERVGAYIWEIGEGRRCF